MRERRSGRKKACKDEEEHRVTYENVLALSTTIKQAKGESPLSSKDSNDGCRRRRSRALRTTQSRRLRRRA